MLDLDELRKIAEREETRYRWVTLSPEGVIELLDRVEKAEAELGRYDHRLVCTENEYNRLETSHSILEQALQRVRELHPPEGWLLPGRGVSKEYCYRCQTVWPCPTIRALEGDE